MGRRPDENQFIAAKRLLAKTLCINPDNVTMDVKNVRMIEEVKESTAYPIKSLYRKRIIMANLGPPPPRDPTVVEQPKDDGKEKPDKNVSKDNKKSSKDKDKDEKEKVGGQK